MKIFALCAAMFAAALLSIGFGIAKAKSDEPHGIVCVVGDLEIGPNSAAKEIYQSKNVDILLDETSAECQRLTNQVGN